MSFYLGSDLGFGDLWTDTAFEICSPDTCILPYHIFTIKYILF